MEHHFWKMKGTLSSRKTLREVIVICPIFYNSIRIIVLTGKQNVLMRYYYYSIHKLMSCVYQKKSLNVNIL